MRLKGIFVSTFASAFLLLSGCGSSSGSLGHQAPSQGSPDELSTVTPLQNGVPVTGLSANKGSSLYFSIVVPAGATSLDVTLTGGTSGTGSASLYVKAGSKPTIYAYDLDSTDPGLEQDVTIIPSATTYFIRVYAATAAFSNATLTATYTLGTTDAGSGPPDSVGADGGTVSSLYFAVVGDTRPPLLDVSFAYPTAIIQKIYSDMESMSPRPQFVVATGDYMYSTTFGTASSTQINKYVIARNEYSGPVFAAMGNHECSIEETSNCSPSPSNNYNAFFNALVRPLGKSTPYYSVPINATDGSWTAKLIVLACNAWDPMQKAWFASAFAVPTTYTFVTRHEPAADTSAPCVNDVETILKTAPYDLSLVGHVHVFATNGRQVTVGTGGAPIDDLTSVHGYSTIQQVAGGWQVTAYDYATALPVKTVTIAH